MKEYNFIRINYAKYREENKCCKSAMAYSFHKLLNFSFGKLWTESVQSYSQFLVCDCTTFVGVHVCKHSLQTLDFFWRKIFSNYLKIFSKSVQFLWIGRAMLHMPHHKVQQIQRTKSYDENTTQICVCRVSRCVIINMSRELGKLMEIAYDMSVYSWRLQPD